MVAIPDKNKFITETSKLVMHALLNTKMKHKHPRDVAEAAREYAIELWRVMRAEAS